MGEQSKIEWTDHTFNPWIGCTKVSPGCANCYAERRSRRFPEQGQWGPGALRKRTSAANWRKPLSWNRRAEAVARDWNHQDGPAPRPRVFCASLADWLDPEVPAEWLADLLALIEETPHLDWLLLTKRPELWQRRMNDVIRATHGHPEEPCDPCPTPHVQSWLDGEAPRNVWLGTSVEDQQRADQRIPHLLEIPARVRFLSCEPLLGPLDLNGRPPNEDGGSYLSPSGDGPRIHWAIAGGESGPGARPMHPDWARSLRDQCQDAGVSFFFKKWGAWKPGGSLPRKPDGMTIAVHAAGMTAWTPDNEHNPLALGHPGWRVMERVGKKDAGRLLDGRTWDEVPS